MSERTRELRRRRHRRKQYKKLKARVAKATVSEKAFIAVKIRKMTTGCEVVIQNLGLEDR